MYHASHLFSLFFSLSLSLTLPIVQSNLSMLMCVGLLTIIWTVLVPQSALPIHIHTVVLRTLESYAYGYYMDCVLLFSGAILCFFPSSLEYNSMGILRLDRPYSLGNNSYIAWHECCIFKNKCFVYLFIFYDAELFCACFSNFKIQNNCCAHICLILCNWSKDAIVSFVLITLVNPRKWL